VNRATIALSLCVVHPERECTTTRFFHVRVQLCTMQLYKYTYCTRTCTVRVQNLYEGTNMFVFLFSRKWEAAETSVADDDIHKLWTVSDSKKNYEIPKMIPCHWIAIVFFIVSPVIQSSFTALVPGHSRWNGSSASVWEQVWSVSHSSSFASFHSVQLWLL
jgi:hypothetical protein